MEETVITIKKKELEVLRGHHWLDSNRLGIIEIEHKLIAVYPNRISYLFCFCFPVRIIESLCSRTTKYICRSRYFDIVQEAQIIPKYSLLFSEKYDDLEITLTKENQ